MGGYLHMCMFIQRLFVTLLLILKGRASRVRWVLYAFVIRICYYGYVTRMVFVTLLLILKAHLKRELSVCLTSTFLPPHADAS